MEGRSFKDGQEFQRLWINDHQYYAVGMGHITKIEVVMEPGPHAFIPYFVVWTTAADQPMVAAKYAAHAVNGAVNNLTEED